MHKWIALHGPIGAGKTTLAEELSSEYKHIVFGDLLKEMVCQAVYPYRPVSLAEMHRRKEDYRRLLQEFGDVVGFNDDPQYIDLSLQTWHGEACIFDCVRSPEQAVELRKRRFIIVKLCCPEEVSQLRRPASAASKAHKAEQPLPLDLVDICLDATRPTKELAEVVRGL